MAASSLCGWQPSGRGKGLGCKPYMPSLFLNPVSAVLMVVVGLLFLAADVMIASGGSQ
jgi:hypothetical protein